MALYSGDLHSYGRVDLIVVMAYIVMAYIFMAYMGMAYIGMAYLIVMAE